MSTDPDDLDKLLNDVKKTIDENRLFIKKLLDDAADNGAETDQEDRKESEVFEEL